jgi:tetratricopeptide (TPR) repeat protein
VLNFAHRTQGHQKGFTSAFDKATLTLFRPLSFCPDFSMRSRQTFRQNAPDPAARAFAEAAAHHQAGRLPEAERLYRVALGLSPRHGDALRLLGTICLQNGRSEQALPLLQAALQEQPQNPEILNCLGIALWEAGRGEEAVTRFRQALAINPAYIEVLNNLGNALHEQGKSEAALDCFKKALSQKPDYVDALNSLGAALCGMGREADARAKFERALQIEPNNAEIITSLAGLLCSEGKTEEGLEHYNRALAHAPGYGKALWGKSFPLLALGEYREGWKLYETGLGRRDMRGPMPFAPVKPWDGKPGPDKHLLIWSEQGLGDSLQFIRYAELCKQRVGKVSVLCPKPLVRLFKALPFIDDAFDPTREGSNFDGHVPMFSLPHLFDTALETVPAAVPYLRVDPEIQTKWAAKFAGVAGVKVGLVWAGSAREGNVAANRIDRQRSVGLERMKPWLDLQGAQFYNLQMGKPAEQIATLGLADRLTDFMGEVADFADTAAIVQNLDLVITVDTSVAHLAGGLGKPVWILSRYNACWRWLQNRPTNPWYPTARIFGQPTLGDWDSVMAEVGRELTLEIAKHAQKC